MDRVDNDVSQERCVSIDKLALGLRLIFGESTVTTLSHAVRCVEVESEGEKTLDPNFVLLSIARQLWVHGV